MSIRKHGRYWKVIDADGALVCITVYRKGAIEVVRRLQALDDAQQWQDVNGPTDGDRGKGEERSAIPATHLVAPLFILTKHSLGG